MVLYCRHPLTCAVRSNFLNTETKETWPARNWQRTLVGVLQPNLLAALDKWAAAQNDGRGRPEAIRRLREIALGCG
jgi:hypothetical protein